MDFALAETLGPAATVNQDADANDTDGHRAVKLRNRPVTKMPSGFRRSAVEDSGRPSTFDTTTLRANPASSLCQVAHDAIEPYSRCSQISRAVAARRPVLLPQGLRVRHGAGLREESRRLDSTTRWLGIGGYDVPTAGHAGARVAAGQVLIECNAMPGRKPLPTGR